LLAAGAMHGAKALGLRIPDDVAVAGYDDLQFSAYLDPPLTTVRVPAYEMGRGAAEALISLLEGQQPKDRASVYSTKLVLRQSA
ncbi:MAG: substrate-binding domain-containing protein, partial [bacterium]|nr:substrate-binding domain-containing protein [bacterium]